MILHSPYIDPVAFHLGPLSVRWYGLAYCFGFLLTWYAARRDRRHDALIGQGLSATLFDAMIAGLWGVVLGGRLGYVLFYAWPFTVSDVWMPFRIWEGGMSFHGGLLGSIVGLYVYARRHRIAFFSCTDLIAPYVPIALFLGRLANWVNGELWGRPTGQDWGMVYPWVDDVLRYPSQWIEAGLEGLLLGLAVFFFSRQDRAPGQVSGFFLLGYALMRGVAECFRMPDAQVGLLGMGLSMGQWLCFPLFLLGLFLLFKPSFLPFLSARVASK